MIGVSTTNAPNDRDLLKQRLASSDTNGFSPLWLVLIGHGTFDGKEARFNLRGPDLATADLADWLRPFHRPVAIVREVPELMQVDADQPGFGRPRHDAGRERAAEHLREERDDVELQHAAILSGARRPGSQATFTRLCESAARGSRVS